MIKVFNLFKEKLNANELKLRNYKLQYIFHLFSFHLINDSVDFNQKIIFNKIIVIDYTPDDDDDGYFIICFDNNLLIIKQNLLILLDNFFKNNIDSVIIFLNNSKKYFDKYITCKYRESSDENFISDEIENFVVEFNIKESTKSLKDFWKKISFSIAAYLIQKSYEKTKINRMKICFDDKSNERKEIEYNKNGFIRIKIIASSNLSIINLVYSIEKEELFVIKKRLYNDEKHDIHQREIYNYKKIQGYSPFICKFYGSNQNCDEKFVILEFINGKTLNDELAELNENEKKKILFEIMLSIEFIHNNHFVYRDLKPNNVMIDSNKIAILIDFDRMISFNEDKILDSISLTGSFGTSYSAPEFEECKFSYESDIYSI